MERSVWPAAALAAAAVLAAAPALAGSLGVSPTRVQLGDDHPADTLVLANTGTEPVLVQIRPYSWSVGAQPERLEDTRELLAMPPMAEIAPGGKQIVRVARRSAPADGTEHAYRLVVSEVPPEHASAGNGVRIAVRLNVPVFVTPQGAVAKPDISASHDAAGTRLIIGNRGGAFLQVSRLTLSGDAGAPLRLDEPAYVLAGEQRSWPLTALGTTPRIHVKAETNIGSIDLVVPVASASRS